MKSAEVLHPGVRIKSEVIPATMSVTNAAELMGVGRPALSNLLNGNTALSAGIAARLEKAFKKFSRKELLDMQAEYDAAQAQKRAPADTKPYVPPFLGIKANQVEEWITHNISARTRLSVLLRTLVHSTGCGLTKVDFPGNDNAERPGWDGFVEASEGTPWVPAGNSGWEFGTNENIKKKADDDFAKSVKAHDKKVRNDTTFIFATPRNWRGKTGWVKDAKAKDRWKDVRDVLEDIQSESLMSGMHTGVYNSRGARWRGEGGDQERELAAKYRKGGRHSSHHIRMWLRLC